ncbi:MAG: radical SAM protein [Ignavibacteriales bacterium]|nr:radical SAM protein [Ignavibacteriales bacterium]
MKRDTYCPRLWSEAFVMQDGAVYSCCHEKPAAIGNLNEKSLAEIMDDAPIRAWRRKSLDGKLACYKGCNLLTAEELAEPRHDSVESDYANVRRLKLQTGEFCNLDCVMCYWQDHRSPERLSDELLRERVDLGPIETIEIQGGEPLAMKEAKRYFEHAAALGKKISFLTNAIMINKRWAELIARHSAFVHVSINAATKATHEAINRGSRWERVLENVRLIREARERVGGEVEIIGHFTMIWRNVEEVPRFLERFRELGFDRADFGYDFRLPWLLRLAPLKKRRLRRATTEALNRDGTREATRAHRLRSLGLIDQPLNR